MDSEQHEKACTLGMKIMENCRNELYSRYPYLGSVFAALPIMMSSKTDTIATDGWQLYVSPAFLLSSYAENPEKIKQGYLHILFHCLSFHIMLLQETELKSKGLPGERYGVTCMNLACDITAAWMLKKMEYMADFPGKEWENEVQRHCFDIIKDQLLPGAAAEKGGISAEQVAQLLTEDGFPYDTAVLEKCFAFDDHSLWINQDHNGAEGVRRRWETLLETISEKQGRHGHRGSERGTKSEETGEIRKGKYDYRKFLKRFAVMREEIELDTESFDYIPYDLGMRMFGNLPFVEPLEYKEMHRLEELVIAIDTSSSCSKETVQRFLNETYSILNEKENFFHTFQVYIIQCDCFLQDVAVLHNEEEWKQYMKEVKIQGRSGTDFRPVFVCVEELRRKKELKNLKALIYFTDGDGIYPKSAPDYETAFVFLEKNDYMDLVPKWAVRLLADVKGDREK